MTFPARGVEIIQALYHASPQDDDARRIDIKRVGEQMAFELGVRWGNKKRAGLSDDFRSPDSIAWLEADGTISVWDIQASSGAILVHSGQEADHPRLPPSEATFMSCEPVNHLGAPPDPDPPPPLPPPAPVDLGPVLEQIADLSERVEVLAALMQRFIDEPPVVTFPVYEGTVAFRYLGTGRAYLEPK